jgi:ATP-binding cassette subfamily F protein 3
MHSCDLLVDALNKYEGSYILVSHDRYFISKTANKIWEIVDHKIKEFKGGYEEYVQWKERMQSAVRGQQPEVKTKKTENLPLKKLELKPDQLNDLNKLNELKHPSGGRGAKKEIQKQQKLLQQLEEKITKTSAEKQRLESALSSSETYADKNKFLETEAAYKKFSDQLVDLNFEYEKVFEKLMQLENQ